MCSLGIPSKQSDTVIRTVVVLQWITFEDSGEILWTVLRFSVFEYYLKIDNLTECSFLTYCHTNDDPG